MSTFAVPSNFKAKMLATGVVTVVAFALLGLAPRVHNPPTVRLFVFVSITAAGLALAVSFTGCCRVAWTVTLSDDGTLCASTWLNLRHWTVPASTIWLIEVSESRYARYGRKPLLQSFRWIEINHAHGMFRVSRHVDHLGELIEAIKTHNPDMELKNRLDWPLLR